MLLDAYGKKCVLIEKKRTGDGAGGYITEWVDGADFLIWQRNLGASNALLTAGDADRDQCGDHARVEAMIVGGAAHARAQFFATVNSA